MRKVLTILLLGLFQLVHAQYQFHYVGLTGTVESYRGPIQGGLCNRRYASPSAADAADPNFGTIPGAQFWDGTTLWIRSFDATTWVAIGGSGGSQGLQDVILQDNLMRQDNTINYQGFSILHDNIASITHNITNTYEVGDGNGNDYLAITPDLYTEGTTNNGNVFITTQTNTTGTRYFYYNDGTNLLPLVLFSAVGRVGIGGPLIPQGILHVVNNGGSGNSAILENSNVSTAINNQVVLRIQTNTGANSLAGYTGPGWPANGSGYSSSINFTTGSNTDGFKAFAAIQAGITNYNTGTGLLGFYLDGDFQTPSANLTDAGLYLGHSKTHASYPLDVAGAVNLADLKIAGTSGFTGQVPTRQSDGTFAWGSTGRGVVLPITAIVGEGLSDSPTSGSSTYTNTKLIGLGTRIQIVEGEMIESNFGSNASFTFNNSTGTINISPNTFTAGTSLYINLNQ